MKTLSFLLAVIFSAALFFACAVGKQSEALNTQLTDNGNTDHDSAREPATEMPETGTPETEAPVTETPETEAPHADPMTLECMHTATVTTITYTLDIDFTLPEGYTIRADHGGVTRLPLYPNPVTTAYIYDPDGLLVGAFTVSRYEEGVPEEWIYGEFAMGHWHIMLEEKNEPIETSGRCNAALTLAEAVDDDGTQPGAFAAYERFICDAIVACDPETRAIIELAFCQGALERDQLIAIAQSIDLFAFDR